jgi:mono/diheme cytochrome c family protein
LTISRQINQLISIAGVATVFALGFPANASAAEATAPTFSKEVAPILFKNCANCHRPGEIASAVSLVSYDTARPWAKAIKEKVLHREMPPWPADPNGSVKFRNDARLSQRDIETLVAWVDAGAPKGNDADLPPIPKSPHGWLHPQGLGPDLVISLPGEVQVPAEGKIPYQRIFAKVPFSEDKWIVAIQARPSNFALVHHMAITEIALDEGMGVGQLGQLELLARQLGFQGSLIGARPAVTSPSNPAVFDMLGVYTPGTTFEIYGGGSAKLLKGGKNMYLVFNIHYEPTGKPEKDRSMIAFWFQQEPPKHQLFRVPGAGETIIANGKELLTDAPGAKAEGTRMAIPPIPPNADNYEVIGVTGYREPVTIYQFQPHAHHHGKDFKYTVVFPDGREETVLSVPKYDFRWQLAYEPEAPVKLPAGSKLVVTAHYENLLKHMHNPGPEKEVYFREQNQGSDEMFTPFLQYSIDSQDLTKPRETAQPYEHEEKENTSQQGRSEQNVLEIAEVVGCLERNPAGKWMLTNASDPVASDTQSTSTVALKAAEAKPLGSRRSELLGVSVFNPSSHQREKVAIKGILIKEAKESRLSVTSLQMVATSCIK